MAAPPELVDDAIAEIFLRLPPDEQALARHPHMRAFLRLGFVDNTIVLHGATSPRFSPTSSMSSFPRRAFDCVCWEALDCRHGRVLQGLFAERVNLVVWDPITGDHRALPDPGLLPGYYSAAVFCAARGCDHLHCGDGGPFRVVLAGMDYFARDGRTLLLRGRCLGRLSTFDPPAAHANEGGIVLVPMDGDGDGSSLGLAGVRGSRLCLWSTRSFMSI